MKLNKVTEHESLHLRNEQIEQELCGYWAEDEWYACDCPLYTSDDRITNLYVKFEQIQSQSLKNEFKYYFFTRLINSEIKLSTVWNKNSAFNKLKYFFNMFYPSMNSILDVPFGKFVFHYKAYLYENGQKDLSVRDCLQLYNTAYSFFLDWYDVRPELEKDIWDVRKLGIDFNKSKSGDYKLDFSSIPTPFRGLVKKYIESRVLVQESLSWGSAMQTKAKLPVFFNYIHNRYPEWDDLTLLSRKDIEDFIKHLKSNPMGGNSNHKGMAPSSNYVNRSIIVLETFIEYIQRFNWNEAPSKPVRILFFPEDKPRLPGKTPDSIKYISDFVWDQIIHHLEKLPQEIIPMVLLLEATGFRISDICELKIDCLIQREDGWWISGEQRKVRDKNHRVPISEEIAKVVLTQQEITRRKSSVDTNPLNYLFPTYQGARKGQPISRGKLVRCLNKLAIDNKIIDDQGCIYKCKAHAFRHRFGVNLINNGMNILHVQKLMAHASPEMTLVYAQIHDTTLRKEWEKAINNGAVRINQSGKIIPTDLEQQANENGLELEWIRHNLDSIRLDHGFCIKSPKHNCDFLEQTLEPPCIKNNCRSFHVDQTFLEFYNDQITKMENDIHLYQKTGRNRSIEIIQPKLKRYIEIRDGIINNGGIFGHPKSRRELKI
jgi:integrase